MSKKIAMLAITGILLTISAQAQFAGTGTTTVSVTVGAEASLQVNTATTTLTNVGTIFNAYTGSTSLTYKMRTTKVGGSGTITLQVTSDFSPANGPSVATPPTAGDALSYTCTAAAPGTPSEAAAVCAVQGRWPNPGAGGPKTGDPRPTARVARPVLPTMGRWIRGRGG